MRRIITALVVTTVALVGIAAPAAADHYISADTGGCFGGAIATGTGQNLSTDKVKIKTSKTGETTWVCTFKGVGASTEEENTYFDYTPPTKTIKYTSIDACWETDESGSPMRTADAQVISKPNGSITFTCTLPAPS